MLDVLNESIDQGVAKACLRVDGQKVVKSQKIEMLVGEFILHGNSSTLIGQSLVHSPLRSTAFHPSDSNMVRLRTFRYE